MELATKFTESYAPRVTEALASTELVSLALPAVSSYLEKLSSEQRSLLPILDAHGEAAGFVAFELRDIPQANKAVSLFIPDIFVGSEEALLVVRQAIGDVLRELGSSGLTFSSISLGAFSHEEALHAAYSELGAERFCSYPIIPSDLWNNIAPGGGTVRVAASEGADCERDAALIAELVLQYRSARTEQVPHLWVAPNADHLPTHIAYLQKKVLPSPNNACLMLYEGEKLVGVAIGVPGKLELNISETHPLELGAENSTCVLDDFYIAKGEDWNHYAPTLLAALRQKLSHEGTERTVFVQSVFDKESVMFTDSLGLRSAHEFYVMLPQQFPARQ